jgi:hypothetical protein
MNCPLCNRSNCQNWQRKEQNATEIECNNCGKFVITAQAMPVTAGNGWKIAAYVKERNLSGITPTLYSSQDAIKTGAPVASVGVDVAIEMFPKTIPDRLDRALLNLGAVTQHLGQDIPINTESPNSLLFARNGSEVFFIIQQFALEGYIKGGTTTLPTSISLTAKGLNHIADLKRGLFGPFNRQVFVAMSFDMTLNAAWAEGLKLGIEDCSFEPLRVDAKEHNEKIDDLIVAEIRKSKFLVADFTLHRAGVYFEAGLMMGLGRPVVFTCHQDHLDKAHFDTRQYNHIAWETPSELREKLKRRIQATIAV